MQNIISEISSYIKNSGGGHPSSWYVGIAGNPRDCLFNRHGVSELKGFWIFRDAGSENYARAIEKVFLDAGYQGGGGGGDYTTRYVYVYLITQNTRK